MFVTRLDTGGPVATPVVVATPATEDFSGATAPPPAPVDVALHASADGDARVTLALPSSSPASLELFDLAGRRIWSRDVGPLGAGTHSVRVAHGVPAGVYLARLMQGERRATARLVIVR